MKTLQRDYELVLQPKTPVLDNICSNTPLLTNERIKGDLVNLSSGQGFEAYTSLNAVYFLLSGNGFCIAFLK